MGRLVGGMLGTLGSLIPGSVGQEFKDVSVTMQSQMQSAGTAVDMPEQKLRQVDHLKSQAGKVGSSVTGKEAEGAKGAAGAAPAGAQAVDRQSEAEQESVPADATTPGARPEEAAVKPEDLHPYVESGTISPEESTVIALQLSPKNPFKTNDYHYWLFTRQIAELPAMDEDAGVEPRTLPAQKSVHRLYIRGISPLFALLTASLLIAVVGVDLALAFLVVRWLLGLIVV